MTVWVWIASFFVILIAFILIHLRVNREFKVETPWVAIALAPAVMWLLGTGQLAEFSGFGLGFKLREASAKPFSLSLEGSAIEPVPLVLGEKGGVSEIPELVRRQVAALTFQLGRRGYYYGPAIRQYLEELTRYDFFRYCVFAGPDGKLGGLVPARRLLEQLRRRELDIVAIIEAGSIDRIDGLVTVAVPVNSNKREALKRMDEQSLAELPVVDQAGRFVGIVERDKLTSSILLELVARP